MQLCLTVAFEFVFIAGLVLMSAQFLSGLMTPLQLPEVASLQDPEALPDVKLLDGELVAQAEANIRPDTDRELPGDETVPAAVAPTPVVMPLQVVADTAGQNYETMTANQMRTLCTASGVEWRSVHGKNKHLSKLEMVSALTALEHEQISA